MTGDKPPGLSDLLEATYVPGPPPGRFTPKPLTELFSRPPKEWLVKDWFGPGDLVMIFGDSGAGKTFVVLDLMISGALGEAVADSFEAPRPFRTLYCTEEGLGGLGGRFKAVIDSKGLAGHQDWIRWTDAIPVLFNGGPENGAEGFIDQVRESEFRPDLIVFDTLADAGQGSDENSNSDAMVVCKAVEQIAKKLNCAVLLIHHASKQSSGTTYRGASVYKAKMDLQVSVTGGPANPRTITCEKLKDGKQWPPILAELVEWPPSAVVNWLGDRTPGMTNQAAETRAWQTDLIDTLERLASSETKAITAQQITAGMKNPPNVKTIRNYLSKTENDARIRSVSKQVEAKDGKQNIPAWHYWIESEDATE